MCAPTQSDRRRLRRGELECSPQPPLAHPEAPRKTLSIRSRLPAEPSGGRLQALQLEEAASSRTGGPFRERHLRNSPADWHLRCWFSDSEMALCWLALRLHWVSSGSDESTRQSAMTAGLSLPVREMTWPSETYSDAFLSRRGGNPNTRYRAIKSETWRWHFRGVVYIFRKHLLFA